MAPHTGPAPTGVESEAEIHRACSWSPIGDRVGSQWRNRRSSGIGLLRRSQLMHKNTKRIASIGLPLAVVATTGIAFAAWTSGGSGTGTATSGTPQPVVFTGGTVVNSLYPTGSGDVAFHSTNPNSYSVALNSLAVSKVTFHDATDDVRTLCGLTFTAPSTAPVVAAGGGNLVLTNALAMTNAADSTCATKTFDVTLSASAVSAAAA